jgi:DNA primase small subunit
MAKESPAHAFHSAAYYETPDAPQMPLKGWLGADLVFDIDADHLNCPCQERHDSWWCLDCGYREKGLRPETCPKCGGSRLDELKWMCEECLGTAKGEAVKLIENFLVSDFGISRSKITVVFSGHRGYHVHCYSDEARGLGSQERREIVDYVQATGLELKFHGFPDDAHGIPRGPDIRTPGWERKMAQGIRELFRTPDQLLKVPELPPQQKQILRSEAASIYKRLLEEPPRYLAPKHVGLAAWQTIAQHVIAKATAAIDEPVTTDVHRLIRLPESLNGKTGFLVKKLDVGSLDTFDPFRDAQVFKGEAEVFVEDSPAFRIGDVEYAAMHQVKKQLPISVAIFLLCKGVAKLAQ